MADTKVAVHMTMITDHFLSTVPFMIPIRGLLPPLGSLLVPFPFQMWQFKLVILPNTPPAPASAASLKFQGEVSDISSRGCLAFEPGSQATGEANSG